MPGCFTSSHRHAMIDIMTSKQAGQATVEYIFVLAFAIILGFNILNKYTDFFRDALGGLNHVLSTHLNIGVCKRECWINSYANSFSDGG